MTGSAAFRRSDAGIHIDLRGLDREPALSTRHQGKTRNRRGGEVDQQIRLPIESNPDPVADLLDGSHPCRPRVTGAAFGWLPMGGHRRRPDRREHLTLFLRCDDEFATPVQGDPTIACASAQQIHPHEGSDVCRCWACCDISHAARLNDPPRFEDHNVIGKH